MSRHSEHREFAARGASRVKGEMSKAYWWMQRTLRSALGSTVEEYRFRWRGRKDVRRGFSNVQLPHRAWLADKLLADRNVEVVMEIGCGWGPNLLVLARRSAQLILMGVDISAASIAEGRAHFATIGVEGVWLSKGCADDLSAFADGSADIVFSDALLLYVGPDKIERTLHEMMRVARSRVVLLEMHQPGAGAGGCYTRDGWVRDYNAVLGLLAGNASVSLEPLPFGLRTAGRWQEYGVLVQVDVKNSFHK